MILRQPGKAAARLLPLVLMAAAALPAQILNRNLVVNGDAESGVGARNATDAKVAPPNWTTTGGFSIGTYGGGDFPATGDYGPANRGRQLFYGGPGSQRSTATQTVDLTGAIADIDAGRVKFYLTGYIGLISGSYDTIAQTDWKAEFQDAAGATLATATAAGPTVAAVNVPSGLLLRSATGFLPPNVRKAKVTIDLFTGSSGYNGYAADNLSLVLTTDAMLGVNLLVNGNGEAAPENDGGKPVPGWNADTNMKVEKYGEYGEPFRGDAGPSDRGVYFFSCAEFQSRPVRRLSDRRFQRRRQNHRHRQRRLFPRCVARRRCHLQRQCRPRRNLLRRLRQDHQLRAANRPGHPE